MTGEPTTHNNPIPAISGLSPASVSAGSAAFTLTVSGTGFLSSSKIRWNGSERTTTFVSATQLTAAITASDVASGGTASVTTVNPAPGGGTSAAAAFTINATVQYPLVEDIGAIRQNLTVRGRDGIFSAEIDGKSYWNFGDTSLTAPNGSGKNFFSNSFAWTDSLNASTGIYLNHDYTDDSGAVTQFIPLTDDERQFNQDHACATPGATNCGEEYAVWDGPIVPVPNSDMVYEFYGVVERLNTSSFQPIGSGIALWNKKTMEITRPVVASGTPHPTLLWQGDPSYNDGAFIDGSYLYALGCKTNWVAKDCRVGRVLVDSALTQAAWEYYTGNDGSGNPVWSTDQNAAVMVFQGGAAGNSVFYNPAFQKYMAVYSAPFTNDVYYRTADHIWGPWSDQTKLFTGMTPSDPNTVDYAAMAHPEFAEQNGNVQYIAYVHITGFLANDIRLVRVTFRKPAQ